MLFGKNYNQLSNENDIYMPTYKQGGYTGKGDPSEI